MLKSFWRKLVGHIQDILNYRKTKEELIKAQEQLNTTIKEQQGMTFKAKKVNGQFIHTLCDGELLYRLGLTPHDVVGQPLESFLPLELARYKTEYYERAWQGEELTYYEGTVNGITYLASLRSIKRKGKVVEIVASCVDITPLKQTEELLRKSETLSVVGQLAASMAHEVRNPLTTLKGFLQLAQQKSEISPSHIQIMLEELDRINFIVSEFLSLTKSNTQFREIELIDLIQSTIKFMEMQANMCNIQLEWGVLDSGSTIWCEPNHIKQVLINLMKNAFEAMPNGGTVRIGIEVDSEYVSVRIQDEGCGIPEDRLAQLGQPFYSTKEKGSGLGLLVCNRIVENHNGKIQFHTDLEKGTTVEVFLPRAHNDSQKNDDVNCLS
ncbi:ATP-binding protein [Ammoniphilus sp. YIM 78166]|uniref:ATP-binding protein n=1 Tax=Ammoniphilus sp. YIM 78166 TaxID=1644106 RepID=UPI00106FECE4|nr:ATP-binding protein [Ammoniphilus sp. YIM 78166]